MPGTLRPLDAAAAAPGPGADAHTALEATASAVLGPGGKSYRRRRLVGVTHRVVFGTQLAVAQLLAAWGWQSNTAVIERRNLDIRQRVAAVGRRVNTLCQGEDGWQHQLAVFHVYHNVVLPHTSLRQPLFASMATNGRGSAKRWQPCTPAMAAGLTDHVWSLKEVLLYRVPPWSQPQVR